MKYGLQFRDLVNPSSTNWCVPIAKACFLSRNQNDTGKMKLDSYEVNKQLLRHAAAGMLHGSIAEQIEQLVSASVRIFSSKFVTCIPPTQSLVDGRLRSEHPISNHCLVMNWSRIQNDADTVSANDTETAIVTLQKKDSRAQANALLHHWVPICVDRDITHVALLIRIDFWAEPAPGAAAIAGLGTLLLMPKYLAGITCWLQEDEKLALKNTASHMNINVQNANSRNMNTNSNVRMLVKVQRMQRLFPQILDLLTRRCVTSAMRRWA